MKHKTLGEQTEQIRKKKLGKQLNMHEDFHHIMKNVSRKGLTPLHERTIFL